MARLRTSFVEAVKYANEIIENEKITIEDAAHKAALRFNENESEILTKIQTVIAREARKTGKVGRPPKTRELVSDKEESEIKKNNINGYIYDGPVYVNVSGNESTLNIKIESNEQTKEDAINDIQKSLFDTGLVTFIPSDMWDENLHEIKTI